MVGLHRKVLAKLSVKRQPFFEKPTNVEEEDLAGDSVVVVVVETESVDMVEAVAEALEEEMVDEDLVGRRHEDHMEFPVSMDQGSGECTPFPAFASSKYQV